MKKIVVKKFFFSIYIKNGKSILSKTRRKTHIKKRKKETKITLKKRKIKDERKSEINIKISRKKKTKTA